MDGDHIAVVDFDLITDKTHLCETITIKSQANGST